MKNIFTYQLFKKDLNKYSSIKRNEAKTWLAFYILFTQRFKFGSFWHKYCLNSFGWLASFCPRRNLFYLMLTVLTEWEMFSIIHWTLMIIEKLANNSVSYFIFEFSHTLKYTLNKSRFCYNFLTFFDWIILIAVFCYLITNQIYLFRSWATNGHCKLIVSRIIFHICQKISLWKTPFFIRQKICTMKLWWKSKRDYQDRIGCSKKKDLNYRLKYRLQKLRYRFLNIDY